MINSSNNIRIIPSLLLNNNTTLWKNMLMNELDYYVTTKGKFFDFINLNKRFRYIIANIFFYKWPLLFDFYKDNSSDYKFKHMSALPINSFNFFSSNKLASTISKYPIGA